MIDDLSTRAILDIAMRGVEKLTEDEMRAIRHIGRSDMLWPGLVAWHTRFSQLPEFKPIASNAILVEEVRQMSAALEAIRRRANSDGTRTFDDVIRDIGWIDDECRRVLCST